MEFLRRTKVKKQNRLACQLAVSFLIFFSISCKKEENNNIPLVEVNFVINLNDPEYIKLKNPGGAIEVTGGSRGIILYRLSQDEIKAYDRHCTFQPSSTCALVSIDPNNITATDPCCNSSFSLTNGTVTNPPAAAPLKEYNTTFDGTFLSVTN